MSSEFIKDMVYREFIESPNNFMIGKQDKKEFLEAFFKNTDLKEFRITLNAPSNNGSQLSLSFPFYMIYAVYDLDILKIILTEYQKKYEIKKEELLEIDTKKYFDIFDLVSLKFQSFSYNEENIKQNIDFIKTNSSLYKYHDEDSYVEKYKENKDRITDYIINQYKKDNFLDSCL